MKSKKLNEDLKGVARAADVNLNKRVKQIWRPKFEPSTSCGNNAKLSCLNVEEENSQIQEVITEGSCSSSPQQISLILKQDLQGERKDGSTTTSKRKSRKKSKSVPSKGKDEFVWMRKKHTGATSDAGRNGGSEGEEVVRKGDDRVDSIGFTRELNRCFELTGQIVVTDSEVCHDLATPNYNWASEFLSIKPISISNLREKAVDADKENGKMIKATIDEINEGFPQETETKNSEHVKNSAGFEASISYGDQMDTQMQKAASPPGLKKIYSMVGFITAWMGFKAKAVMLKARALGPVGVLSS
ncbi:hypothetical protein NE237_027062 [Protea cynaroides]|uniref:Uncharacterized protein n=1 Tax=Protea cynaroides TaxID=273540 RepID=A0A9Q0GPR9_9MAGN|nr:hypothetical protein NE237_027062 [Protea cynaroides]